MYKTRIHQWGLDKKLKEHEARAIIHMHARRRGKATRMRLRDVPVDIQRVYSHFQRKGITVDSVLDSDAVSLPDLVCETPPMSPRPTHQALIPIQSADITIPEPQDRVTAAGPRDLGSPRAFRMVEMLLVDIREYSLISIHIKYGDNPFGNTLCDLFNFETFQLTLKKASFFMYCGAEDYSCEMVISNLKHLFEEMFCEAPFLMIKSIAMFLSRECKQRSQALVLCMQLFTATMNSQIREQPLIFILGRLLSTIGLLLRNDDAPDYLLAAVHVFIDSLKTILGPFHQRTVCAAVILARVTRYLYGPTGVLRPLEALRSSLEMHNQSGTSQSIFINQEIRKIHNECKTLPPSTEHL